MSYKFAPKRIYSKRYFKLSLAAYSVEWNVFLCIKITLVARVHNLRVKMDGILCVLL